MQVSQLVRPLLRELHVWTHALDQQPAECLFFGEHTPGSRCEREYGVRFVQHQDGSDSRCLALCRRQPAQRQVREALGVSDSEDDVVLLDDAGIEAIRLLVCEA